MRVLNIMSRFNVGGTAPWLFHLSNGLSRRGIENSSLLGSCPPSEIEDSRISALQFKKIAGLGPGSSPFSTLKAIGQVRREINEYRPDVVNTHTSRAGVIGRIASIGLRPRPAIVHTFHGHVLKGYFGNSRVLAIRIIERALSHLTDYFFVVGESVKRELESEKIVDSKRSISVWPAVADLRPSISSLKRETMGIPQQAIAFGWLGRKVPIKRLDRVIELAKLRPQFYFIVAGAGPRIKELYPEEFSTDELRNIVEMDFTKPEDFWTLPDVGILTSDNEGIPSAPIEAALLEKPTILTNVGSVEEVVIDQVTGLLCDKTVESLLKAVDLLVENESLRLEMGRKARLFAMEKFNPDSSVDRQIEGYAKSIKSIGRD